MALILLISFSTLFMTLRAFLIVIGTYKDPVLASFENYGEEQIFSPIYSLMIWGGAFFYVLLFVYFGAGLIVVLGLLLLILGTAFKDYFQHLLHKYHTSFRVLPRWYFDLARRTDREERRRIAYLWLRLPYKTRLLYNARSEHFHKWVDLVLLSITG